MISLLILVLSLSAFSQFFLLYCRAVVLAYEQVEISPASRKLAGLEAAPISGEAFGRILGLASLCPIPAGDRVERLAARLYFFSVSALRLVIPTPALSSWADSQRAACAHFAAVALDRRVLATVSAKR
jgi:hypothetical protein